MRRLFLIAGACLLSLSAFVGLTLAGPPPKKPPPPKKSAPAVHHDKKPAPKPKQAHAPTPDVWKETREFVIKEVSSTIAGFDAKGRAELADKVKKLLDRAYGMSDAQLKKEWSEMGKGLRGEVAAISNWHKQGPTGIINHVLERDFAELFSNPRLLPAIEAREDYIKKASQ